MTYRSIISYGKPFIIEGEGTFRFCGYDDDYNDGTIDGSWVEKQIDDNWEQINYDEGIRIAKLYSEKRKLDVSS